MNQYKIFQKSIHYQVILRMINMRLCLLQKICCGMCAIAAFKRSFLKIIISCLPIHFPSSSKKIFRFTFLLGFSFVLVCTLFIRNERNLWPNHGVKPILSEEIFTANAFFYILFFYIGTLTKFPYDVFYNCILIEKFKFSKYFNALKLMLRYSV